MRNRYFLEYRPSSSNIHRFQVPSRVWAWFNDSAGDITFYQMFFRQTESIFFYMKVYYYILCLNLVWQLLVKCSRTGRKTINKETNIVFLVLKAYMYSSHFFCFKFPNTICYDNFAFVYQIFTFTRESDTAYSILKIKSDKCKCSNTSFTPQPTNPHPIPLSLTPFFNNKKNHVLCLLHDCVHDSFKFCCRRNGVYSIPKPTVNTCIYKCEMSSAASTNKIKTRSYFQFCRYRRRIRTDHTGSHHHHHHRYHASASLIKSKLDHRQIIMRSLKREYSFSVKRTWTQF